MKRSLYNLTDEPFAMFVNRVGKVFRDIGIKHNIVGGVAVQAYMLRFLAGERDIVSFLDDSNIRIQDYFRNTDDVDVSLNLQFNDNERRRIIEEILPQFEFEDISPVKNYIVGVKLERHGVSRPTFKFYVDGDNESYEEIISMNISRNQEGDLHKLNDSWYKEFLNQSKKITIPYCQNFNLEINAPVLEHLLASKIALSRAKDLMDIKNLSGAVKDSGIELDFNKMDNILLPYHENNYCRFLKEEYPFEFKRLL